MTNRDADYAEPTAEPMRAGGDKIRRKPSTDQKKVRHQQNRRQASEESVVTDLHAQERTLLAKLARATTYEERKALVGQVERVRCAQRDRADAEKLSSLTGQVADLLAPVATWQPNSTDTDWMVGEDAPLASAVASAVVEAHQWYARLNPDVAQDRAEVAAQADGAARVAASRHPLHGDAVERAFRAEAHKLAGIVAQAYSEDDENNDYIIVSDWLNMGIGDEASVLAAVERLESQGELPASQDLATEYRVRTGTQSDTKNPYWQQQYAKGGARRTAADSGFSPTHTYEPIGWDRFDPKVRPGHKPIKPGAPVEHMGPVGDPAGVFVYARDEDGNEQSVDRHSLKRIKRGAVITASRRTAGIFGVDVFGADGDTAYFSTQEKALAYADEVRAQGGRPVVWEAQGGMPIGYDASELDKRGSRRTAAATTTTWYDANGFLHTLPYPVNFSLEESDQWFCKVCNEDVDSDVDDAGHSYDGETAEQIWTATPLDGDGDGDVFTGTFDAALAYFTKSFMGKQASRRTAVAWTLDPDDPDWIGNLSDEELASEMAYWSSQGPGDVQPALPGYEDAMVRQITEEQARRSSRPTTASRRVAYNDDREASRRTAADGFTWVEAPVGVFGSSGDYRAFVGPLYEGRWSWSVSGPDGVLADGGATGEKSREAAMEACDLVLYEQARRAGTTASRTAAFDPPPGVPPQIAQLLASEWHDDAGDYENYDTMAAFCRVAEDVADGVLDYQADTDGPVAAAYVAGQVTHADVSAAARAFEQAKIDYGTAQQQRARGQASRTAAFDSSDLVGAIMDYEQGEMSEEDTAEFFQYLIDTGMAWQLQGSYGRTATDLINAGVCHAGSRRTAYGRNPEQYPYLVTELDDNGDPITDLAVNGIEARSFTDAIAIAESHADADGHIVVIGPDGTVMWDAQSGPIEASRVVAADAPAAGDWTDRGLGAPATSGQESDLEDQLTPPAPAPVTDPTDRTPSSPVTLPAQQASMGDAMRLADRRVAESLVGMTGIYHDHGTGWHQWDGERVCVVNQSDDGRRIAIELLGDNGQPIAPGNGIWVPASSLEVTFTQASRTATPVDMTQVAASPEEQAARASAELADRIRAQQVSFGDAMAVADRGVAEGDDDQDTSNTASRRHGFVHEWGQDYVGAERWVDEYRGDTGVDAWVVEVFEPVPAGASEGGLGELFVVDQDGLDSLEGQDYEVQYP